MSVRPLPASQLCVQTDVPIYISFTKAERGPRKMLKVGGFQSSYKSLAAGGWLVLVTWPRSSESKHIFFSYKNTGFEHCQTTTKWLRLKGETGGLAENVVMKRFPPGPGRVGELALWPTGALSIYWYWYYFLFSFYSEYCIWLVHGATLLNTFGSLRKGGFPLQPHCAGQ